MSDYGGSFMKAALTAVLAFLICLPAEAGLQDEFLALKDSGKDYRVVGTICEEVARLQLARIYRAPAYTVVTGIAYGNQDRTIGELDVIVFENRTGEAIKVAEVKCWRDMSAGLHKALDQRSRFLRTINSPQRLFFRSTTTNEYFDQSQFDSIQEFFSIAQRGATRYGYDQELQYSLEELMTLRSMLIACQDRGECARRMLYSYYEEYEYEYQYEYYGTNY